MIFHPVLRGKTLAQTPSRLGVSRESLSLALKWSTGGLFSRGDDRKAFLHAISWLALAQDACSGAGISAEYSLKFGWDPPYPETSGYIIATFLAYAKFVGQATFRDRALQLGHWLLSIQAENGGVPSRLGFPQLHVFNTGQVILGWCTLFRETGDERFLSGAKKAANFILDGQEADGSWIKNTYCGPRTYHARVSWSLLELSRLLSEERLAQAAEKNLSWVVNQQHRNGWFDCCGFNRDLPNMHVISYTLRGLLESHLLFPERLEPLRLPERVNLALEALLQSSHDHPAPGFKRMLRTSFDQDWGSRDGHACLTGNAQLVNVLSRYGRHFDRADYAEFAIALIHDLHLTVNQETSFAAVRGALPGSHPFYHGYKANSFPNWATKFWADALFFRLNPEVEFNIPA